jgi:uncharacterized protein YajQ (UPF0234 family)
MGFPDLLPKKLYRNPLHAGALRNQGCICGSGKKIKRCHGQKYAILKDEAKEINQMIAQYTQKQSNNAEAKNV